MTPKEGETAPRPQTPPTQFPETTPPNYPSTDHSFTVQGIFELKASVATLTEAVKTLKETVNDQSTELRTIQRMLWTGTGGVIVASAIIGFVINQMWDTLVELAELVRHLPAR